MLHSKIYMFKSALFILLRKSIRIQLLSTMSNSDFIFNRQTYIKYKFIIFDLIKFQKQKIQFRSRQIIVELLSTKYYIISNICTFFPPTGQQKPSIMNYCTLYKMVVFDSFHTINRQLFWCFLGGFPSTWQRVPQSDNYFAHIILV